MGQAKLYTATYNSLSKHRDEEIEEAQKQEDLSYEQEDRRHPRARRVRSEVGGVIRHDHHSVDQHSRSSMTGHHRRHSREEEHDNAEGSHKPRRHRDGRR